MSPAAFRLSWRAPEAPADVVVLLDRAHHGPPRVERASDGEAALRAARMLIGGAGTGSEKEQADTMVRVLEALSGVTAYRAWGTPPAELARVLEQELAA